MPSQSRSEGDSTPDHLMATESPDRFRVLGEMETVALALAEDTKVETKRRRRRKDKLTTIAIDATTEEGVSEMIAAGEGRYNTVV